MDLIHVSWRPVMFQRGRIFMSRIEPSEGDDTLPRPHQPQFESPSSSDQSRT